MRVSLRLRLIVLMLALVALCCPGRASNAAIASWPSASILSAPAALGSDTSSLQLVGSLGGSATCIQVVGTRAYVGGPDSLRVVDVSNSASPAVLGSAPGEVADVHLVGDVAYLAGSSELRID